MTQELATVTLQSGSGAGVSSGAVSITSADGGASGGSGDVSLASGRLRLARLILSRYVLVIHL